MNRLPQVRSLIPIGGLLALVATIGCVESGEGHASEQSAAPAAARASAVDSISPEARMEFVPTSLPQDTTRLDDIAGDALRRVLALDPARSQGGPIIVDLDSSRIELARLGVTRAGAALPAYRYTSTAREGSFKDAYGCDFWLRPTICHIRTNWYYMRVYARWLDSVHTRVEAMVVVMTAPHGLGFSAGNGYNLEYVRERSGQWRFSRAGEAVILN